MNFAFTWIMEKLGYMPKVSFHVGKVVDFPVKPTKKPAKKTVAKKATKVVKKAK